jgi:hypothetical protein
MIGNGIGAVLTFPLHSKVKWILYTRKKENLHPSQQVVAPKDVSFVECCVIMPVELYFCRRPILEGDNCWRGHAAAFLKYANVAPEVLRKGRVSQVNQNFLYIKL